MGVRPPPGRQRRPRAKRSLTAQLASIVLGFEAIIVFLGGLVIFSVSMLMVLLPTKLMSYKAFQMSKKAADSARPTTTKKTGAVKKTTAPQAAADALVVKDGEDAWTPAELAEVLSELEEQRAHSLGIVAEQEAELSGLMRDSGDGAGQDQADLGATTFERDHEMSVLNSERDKLAQIDRALARIADGTYGVCESCGQPIGKLRLMAFPRATLCMTCKQREERR